MRFLVRQVQLRREFLFHVISVIIKGAIVSPHAPKKVFRRNRPKMYLFFHWKGAEVPDFIRLS